MSRRRSRSPAEVVLGLVDAGDVRPLMEEDPLFRAEVERLRATAGALERLDRDAWRPEEPPALGAVPPPRAAPRRRRRWLVAPALGLAAAAVLAVVLVRGGADDATTVRLQPLAGVTGSATLTIHGAQAELQGQGLPPSGRHDYYEAWLTDARGRMVTMGTFRVARDGHVDARMPVAVDLHRFRGLDVSLEPDDGNPAHSATSVLRATL